MKNGNEILLAKHPSDIFTMNIDTLEQERDKYLREFKKKDYNNIKNFLISQRVIILYREAKELLSDGAYVKEDYKLILKAKSGKEVTYRYHYKYEDKLCTTYVTENCVIYVFPSIYKKYYDNYINKVKSLTKVDKKIWEIVQYMVPNIINNFEDINGNYVIILSKYEKVYPLKEILKYFDNKLLPEYVASIISRLFLFMCYLDIIGISHNGIILDNLFFAPGKEVEEGMPYTIDDVRIVGVYGGWSFSTNSSEPIFACPRIIFDLFDNLPKYSSYKLDTLSIKQIARELLGDITGNNLTSVPKAFVEYVNDNSVERTAYEEYKKWEKVIIDSFGKQRFVEIDVSI